MGPHAARSAGCSAAAHRSAPQGCTASCHSTRTHMLPPRPSHTPPLPLAPGAVRRACYRENKNREQNADFALRDPRLEPWAAGSRRGRGCASSSWWPHSPARCGAHGSRAPLRTPWAERRRALLRGLTVWAEWQEDSAPGEIEVFWPAYEGIFPVTPSSVIGLVRWPPVLARARNDISLLPRTPPLLRWCPLSRRQHWGAGRMSPSPSTRTRHSRCCPLTPFPHDLAAAVAPPLRPLSLCAPMPLVRPQKCIVDCALSRRSGPAKSRT